jgi:phosphatidylserine/phosphatidylglycerophosphate/cardiolipin synthase-like enzyme
VVCGYFRLVREAWVERLEWAERKQSAAGNQTTNDVDVCSCIGSWEHFGGIVLSSLVNQVVEQLMIREASDCLRDNLELCRVWNTELYAPDSCPSLESMKGLYLDGNVHLFSGLEDYLSEYIEAALRSKSTIDICTCYLFRTEVATRYILLDLLPYLAQHCGVKVRVLFEAMTLESQILHTAFDDGTLDKTSCMEEHASFIESLPDGSPPFDRAAKKYLGASDLVRDFMEIASHTANIEVRFWMARDKRMKYRVKNHTKCNIFDGATVIAGGSNLVPREGSRDTDLLMTGAVASMYQLDFDRMWKAMGADTNDVASEEKKEVDMTYCTDAILAPEKHDHDSAPKLGHESKMFFLASQPSSIGEDVILRCILGAIRDAKESIHICMGHFNVPVPAAEALKSATERGVKVRVLANSLYSCDLRGGQRDLFVSLMNMLAIAPKIDLFVTTVKDGKKPHFLHSKYIVVDSEFSAVGSYNMWTRSAFYEKESEVFIYSKDFASQLIHKFDKENEEYCTKVESVEECKHFLPKGCSLCKGFGPFYDC